MDIRIPMPSKLINGIYRNLDDGRYVIVKNRIYENYFQYLKTMDKSAYIVSHDYDIEEFQNVTESVISVRLFYTGTDIEKFKIKLKLIQ